MALNRKGQEVPIEIAITPIKQAQGTGISLFVRDLTETKESQQKIEETTTRIAKIVNDLRTFARDGEKDPFEEVLFSQILANTLELCQTKFLNHNVKQINHSNDGLKLFCQPTQISQVILNLLSNAYDASLQTTEKWVRIESSVVGDVFELRVIDSGDGIPSDIRDKIMNPFFTTKAFGKDTGLGLSLSKGIIESHDGKILIDDKCKNTCFVVQIPLKSPKQKYAQAT